MITTRRQPYKFGLTELFDENHTTMTFKGPYMKMKYIAILKVIYWNALFIYLFILYQDIFESLLQLTTVKRSLTTLAFI